MYDINELLAKELFWTKVNGRNELMTVRHYSGSAEIIRGIDFPRIPICYEEELKQLGVSYEIDGDDVIIYDPNVKEYHDITAPFMVLVGMKPKQISASPVKYTGKIPTNDMLVAAHSYHSKVWEDIKQLSLSNARKYFMEHFAEYSEDGILRFHGEFFRDNILSVSELFSGEWGSKFRIILIPRGIKSGYYIVILKAEVKGKSQITLKVPEWYAGKFIGSGGRNVKALARELGVGYVKIEAES